MKLILENVKAHFVKRELDWNPQLWDEWPLRTMEGNSPHAGCQDIWLRFRDPLELGALAPEQFFNGRYEPRWYPCMDRLKHTKVIIDKIFRLVDGEELGACLITKVPPGKEVLVHSDNNWNANHFLNKYLLIIENSPGAYFETLGERHEGRPGSLYLFDNRLPHRVVNQSGEDRVSLIMSIKQKNQAVAA